MNNTGQLVAVIQVPHPPIMVKEVAKSEFYKVEKTAQAMEAIAQVVDDVKPEALIVISPHGPVFSDAIGIYALDKLTGDLSQFGLPQVKIGMDFDRDLAEAIVVESGKDNIYSAFLDTERLQSFGLSAKLDHGVVAPLSFFKNIPPSVIMGMGLFPSTELYAFGICLRRAIERSGKKVVIVVSGDLSHKITTDAPAGYHPHGEVFDSAVQKALETGDFKALFEIPQDVCENAGECGYRSLIMGLGALDGFEVNSKIYSYQAPFGVGYLVAEIKPGKRDINREFLEQLKNKQQQIINDMRENESPPVKLARMTVENYVSKDEIPDSAKNDIGLTGQAGVFVSIKKNGQLRGCIGTTAPTTGSIAEEIIRNAINAAIQDPRFYPVTEDELASLTYSVDVLTEAVPVQNRSELDPKKFGVIVRSRSKSGLLLPDLEGVDTVDEQLNIALQKAGIKANEDYQILKFEVIRYK